MLYRLSYSRMVGAARSERAAPRSQSRCATSLRHAPKGKEYFNLNSKPPPPSSLSTICALAKLVF